MTRKRTIAALVLPALLATTSAFAQDDATRAAARALGTEGVEAYQAGDYQVAVKKLEQAYAVLSVPSLALWLGRAKTKSGHLVAAAELYLEATRLPVSGSQAAVQRQAQTDAETERQALLSRIPTLVITVRGGDSRAVQLDIDGAPVPSALLGAKRPTDPGPHVVTATRGGERVTATVTLAERESQQVELNLDQAVAVPPGARPPAPVVAASPPSAADARPSGAGSSTQRTLGWVSLGVGGAGLVVGSVFGAIAIGQKSSLESECPDGTCPPRYYGDVDSYYRSRIITTVGLVVGAVGVAGGVTLLLTAPKKQTSDDPQLAAWVGLGRAGLKGSF